MVERIFTMEIKETLNKPYTEQERIQFIIRNNHRLGYEIKETVSSLEAWGYTAEEIAEQEKQAKITEINAKIKELESESVYDVLNGNLENVQVYKDVIKGLEETRDNL